MVYSIRVAAVRERAVRAGAVRARAVRVEAVTWSQQCGEATRPPTPRATVRAAAVAVRVRGGEGVGDARVRCAASRSYP